MVTSDVLEAVERDVMPWRTVLIQTSEVKSIDLDEYYTDFINLVGSAPGDFEADGSPGFALIAEDRKLLGKRLRITVEVEE